MTLFLLDSTELIKLGRRDPLRPMTIARRISRGDEFGSCEVTVAEYYAGRPVGRDPDVDRFIEGLSYWSLQRRDAIRAGMWRYEFRRRGIQLSTTDMLIAAVALRMGAVIVSDNLKDFPMEGVVTSSIANL